MKSWKEQCPLLCPSLAFPAQACVIAPALLTRRGPVLQKAEFRKGVFWLDILGCARLVSSPHVGPDKSSGHSEI